MPQNSPGSAATAEPAVRQSHQKLAWVTGARGLLGNYLLQTAKNFLPDWRIRGLVRDDVDFLDFTAVRKLFESDRPDLVIHCAAISQSTICQKDPALARGMNVDATAFLAKLAADISFVFFSTDLVFDGRVGNYDETSPVNPLSVYGETKAVAEQIVLSNPRHTVIRTSLNGGTSPSGNRGFNEQLRASFMRGETLRLFTDEFRCPIPAIVTARATWELVRQHRAGLYNVAGAERLSRWQIGKLLAARWPELHPNIETMSIKEFEGMPRPSDTSLNSAKARALLPFPLPGLSEWLAANPAETF